jgi:energy-coupling factor transporter ATP-binding protein EcfA2
MTNDLWLEKYRPTTLKEYIGRKDDIKEIREWIENFETRKEKFLVLYGNPGVGKTTLARIIFNKYNYETVEINTSDYRSKKMIKERIGVISGSSVIMDTAINKKNPFKTKQYKKIGVLMDEIDGITMNTESSGIQELIDIIVGLKKKKKNKFPIICTCNSIKNKKIKLLTKNALTLRITKPSLTELKKLGEHIIKNENIPIKKQILKELIENIKEYRELINVLYQIHIYYKNNSSQSKKKLTSEMIITNIMNKSKNQTINENNTSTRNKEVIVKQNNDYITDNSIKLLDNIQSKIKYIMNNDVNNNDVRLIVNSDSNIYFLSIFSNYLNIIKHYKLNKEIQYKIIKDIIKNNAISELYNSKIFLKQTWELKNYLSEIGIISNIKLMKYNSHFYNNSKTPQKIKFKNYILEHHYEFNKMAQDEGFFNRRKTFLNNNIQVNEIQSLYYIDKLMNLSLKNNNQIKNNKKKSKTKLTESKIKYNKIIETNEKINRKITDYISSII